MATETISRLEARLPAEVHAMLKRAAQIEGRSLTDFVVAAAREAALKTIETSEIIRLSAEDQGRFVQSILDPPAFNDAMQRAIDHHRRTVDAE